MNKTLFAIIISCLAVSMAFGQEQNENIQLSEDNQQKEISIFIDNDEHGYIYVKRIDEPDNLGRTPVQIELQNTSNKYEFLLFDHNWSKRDLRKNHIVLDKSFTGGNSVGVDNIGLFISGSINTIEKYSRENYKFQEIRVKEGVTFECEIPIHLAKSAPGWFWGDRKKLMAIKYCKLSITVDNTDKVFEEYKNDCFELLDAFYRALEHEDFCTNPLHPQSFKDQISVYTNDRDSLCNQIRQTLDDKGWSKESNRYKQYQALLDSLDRMDEVLAKYEHDCGKHKPKKQISCGYCDLNFEEIYNRLGNIYKYLHKYYENLTPKEKSEIKKNTEDYYRCCKSHPKHSKQWNNNLYKEKITNHYEAIKKILEK